MGGLGPGIGGFELVVIGVVALLVVGPKDLPILMRRVGQMVAKARAMANEFRSSFDEMARQSELDDLRKEVEALRQGQDMYPLGKQADAAFKDIDAELSRPADALTPPVTPALPTPAVDEWPDAAPAVAPAAPEAEAKPKPRRAVKLKAAAAPATAPKTTTKARTSKPAAKPRAPRKKASDQ